MVLGSVHLFIVREKEEKTCTPVVATMLMESFEVYMKLVHL